MCIRDRFFVSLSPPPGDFRRYPTKAMSLDPIEPSDIPTLFRAREFDRIINGIESLLREQSNDSVVHPNWYCWLAICYYFTSKFRRSIMQYNVVLRLDPDAVNANTNLAHIYSCCPDSTFHNASFAIKYARHACHVSRWKHWLSVQALITSYLRTGDFASASRYAKKSLAMADEFQLPRVQVLLQCIDSKQPYTTTIAEDFAKLDLS